MRVLSAVWSITLTDAPTCASGVAISVAVTTMFCGDRRRRQGQACVDCVGRLSEYFFSGL